MQESSTVRLELSSRPECVSLVRGMLAGVSELLEFDRELVDDLKTAVSEACNNVALHAYTDGRPGPLVVALAAEDDAVAVVVRDWGEGINQIAPSGNRLHVGMALINALADRVEFVRHPEGGTEVRMAFDRDSGLAELRNAFPDVEVDDAWRSWLNGDIVVALSPVGLLSGVLGRLVRAMAASARFTLDRFSDLYLVTDAVAAHARNSAERRLISFAVRAGQRRLEVTVGPFHAGTTEQLHDTSSTEQPVLLLLADELTIEPINSSEFMRLVLQDQIGGGTLN